MPELLTESFCERCGTRYTFETPEPTDRRSAGLKRARILARGFRHYVMSQDSIQTAFTEAERDEERERTSAQLEAFHQTFNFCMDCRQYTCRGCWNESEGRCLTCAPRPGQIESVLAASTPAAALEPPTAAAPAVAEGLSASPEAAAPVESGPVSFFGGAYAEAPPLGNVPATPEPTAAPGPPVLEPEPAAQATAPTPVAAEAWPAPALPGAQDAAPAEEVPTTPEAPAAQPLAAEPLTEEPYAEETLPPAEPAVAEQGLAAAAALEAPAPQATAPEPGGAEEPAAAPLPSPPAPPAPTPPPAVGPWTITSPARLPVAGRPSSTPTPPAAQPPAFPPGAAWPPAPPPGTPAWPPMAAAQDAAAWPPSLAPAAVEAASPNLWEASSVGVVSRPGSGVQACLSCGLPLSATARFCRRCGAKQG